MNRSLVNTELPKVVYKYLGNSLHKTELCIVLQVLVGNLNVLYKFVEVICILSLLIQEYINIEFIIIVGDVVVSGYDFI